MKIDFEGVTRVLDLEHVKLRHAVTIQEFTGLPVFAWQERVAGVSALDAAKDARADGGTPETPVAAQVAEMLRKSPMMTDPAWIMSVAAAHWLMLVQNEHDAPPLDDDYDCDVLGFHLAFLTALGEEVKAKRVPDKPDPTARRARRTPSSKRTEAPKKPIPIVSLQLSDPLPRTGS